MRRQGFTLLETVIALGIAIVVLGATVSTRQAVLRSSQTTETQTIMTTLVSDAIEKLRFTRQLNPADFSRPFMKDAGQTLTNETTVYTLPYVADATPNKNLVWCSVSPYTSAACKTYVSRVRESASGTLNGDILRAGAPNPPAEIVAIAKTSADGTNKIFSLSTYTKAEHDAFNAGGNNIVAGTAASDGVYDYFYRKVALTKHVESAKTGNVANCYTYYTTTVTVWPYKSNEAAGVSRTEIFTDVATNPFTPC